MTDDREFEGKDLAEALTLAAEALGVPQDDLHYEMVEQGRRGLLGLGVKAVRIRVKPPIESELPMDEPVAEPAPARPAPRPPQEAPAPLTGAPGEVERTIRRIVELMGLELEVEARLHDDGVSVQLRGPDQKLLLAKDAELLSALQFLLNRMQRRSWPELGRIQVGCNGHARPRDEELVSMARKVAKQVARTGKTRKLRPMNAYERRLVHLTVREFVGLTSSSDGDGSLKRVRISKVRNEI